MTHARGGRDRAAPTEVASVMAKLGVIGFGGPAAHLALMRDEAVVRRDWLTEQEYVDLIGAASVLPGPTSTQVSMLLGKGRAGWLGLVVAGCCFIVPAMLIVLALAVVYVHWGTTVAVAGLLYGVKPVVIAIVVHALWGLLRTAIRGRVLLAAGAAVIFAAYLAGVNALLAMLGAGLVVMIVDNAHRRGPLLSLWLPIVVSGAPGRVRSPRLVTVFVEFLKLGCVVFGSGYVLLAFLRRDLVSAHHWLSTRQMLDAVAVGQFTPGPVFTTATFVGYLVGGAGGALLATLGIFLPSFVLMTALDPLVPRLRSWSWSSAVLDGFNAGALGLMAGVSVDLGRSAVTDWLTAAVAVVAVVVLSRRARASMPLLLVGAAVGLVHALA